ncbi:hypothetical protein BG846_03267 [Streptomyces fradiae ATCC 10745 = DSM 40063]|uniref:Uncharacterized protein n=1 Tax=Streptomyces fradiae ATCC 10745 = DSM 40063 TaxID=1319510 RepID=A0A1Y2NU53_STRFR|nr:hypothetical protein BG846_03267 [Streptomyces fradiae ATCC 10745 = DSM 40063]
MSWYAAAHASTAGTSARTNRPSGIRASRHATITGIRPAGTSRDTTSTGTRWSCSLVCARSSRSGSARARSASSHREPPRDTTPRRPSQNSAESPASAAVAATRKTAGSASGADWW